MEVGGQNNILTTGYACAKLIIEVDDGTVIATSSKHMTNSILDVNVLNRRSRADPRSEGVESVQHVENLFKIQKG